MLHSVIHHSSFHRSSWSARVRQRWKPRPSRSPGRARKPRPSRPAWTLGASGSMRPQPVRLLRQSGAKTPHQKCQGDLKKDQITRSPAVFMNFRQSESRTLSRQTERAGLTVPPPTPNPQYEALRNGNLPARDYLGFDTGNKSGYTSVYLVFLICMLPVRSKGK